jgi:hypothetical protein
VSGKAQILQLAGVERKDPTLCPILVAALENHGIEGESEIFNF